MQRSGKPPQKTTMKKTRPYDEPGQQLFWKVTLTVLCAIVGALLAHFLFRVF